MKSISQKFNQLLPTKNLPQLYLLSLILFYFLLGLYFAQTNSLTSDEPAYIGTAYFYQHGQGYNIEHPLLLKIANAIALSIFFPDLQVEIPNINPADSLQVNLAPYTMAVKFLMSFPQQVQNIVISSRFIYLCFNSILLFWLYLYTFIIPKISPKISLTLATLYVFSPSFYSHSFLITFDCSAAIYALLTIFSIAILILSLNKWSDRDLIIQFLIITTLIFCAINVKFSNLILLPIVILTYALSLIYLLMKQNFQRFRYFGILSLLSILIQPLLIANMYHYAFGDLPGQSLLDNLNRFFQGALKTKSMVDSVKEPFWNGDFVPLTYSQYISKIFWYKENLGLFVLVIIGFLIFVYRLWKFYYQENHLPLLKDKIIQLGWQKLAIITAFILLFISYPSLYFFAAKDSRFVIGYRHFYPVLIFIYLFVSSLTVIFRKQWQILILKGCLALYIVLGIAGIPQSLSYVNGFWSQEKWMLTNDSTLNWGQENLRTANYLVSHHLLEQEKTLTYRTFGVVININEYLTILGYDLQNKKPLGYFEPLKQVIDDLPYNYLLIDSTALQDIYSQRNLNQVAEKNWRFIRNNKPIYTHNDIIFLYNLKKT